MTNIDVDHFEPLKVTRARPHQGELGDSAGGAFGRRTLFNTATPQELLNCNHSQEHASKGSGKGGRCKLVCEKRTVETHRQNENDRGGGY